MQNMSLILLVQVDALRYDYLTEVDLPFFLKLRCQGCLGLLIPTFGFEPDAAYIAGLFPDEADSGAQFWYYPDDSPFRFMQHWPKWLSVLHGFPEKILRKMIRLGARAYSQSPTLSTARIPFQLLKYFSFPMKCRMDQPGFVEGETVFDLLIKEGRPWFFHGIPRYKVDMDSVIHHVDKELFPPAEFAFIHIGDLDRKGHRYGPESEEIKKTLKKIDEGLRQIYEISKSRYEDIYMIIIGDHGMMEVTKHIDIWNQLNKLQLELEKDYLVFLDSTMCRFWFFTAKAKTLITELLNNVEEGHVLSQEEKDRYHLNYSHNKFGDVIFLLDPGVLIFPNFYQNYNPVKGMHGYSPETPEQQSTLIIHSPKIKEPKRFDAPVDMRRVFPTVLDLLNLSKPTNICVESLLQ